MAWVRTVTLQNANIANTENLLSFPMLFSGTYSYLKTVANGGRVLNADGRDIYFISDLIAQTVLDFELVQYNPVTGDVEFFIRIPVIPPANLVIYLVYGSTITSSLANKHAVWDSSFVAVYHFGDGVTLDLSDSTANGLTAVNFGATLTHGLMGTTGVAGGGVAFLRASSQYMSLGTSPLLNLRGPLTLETLGQQTDTIGPSDGTGLLSKSATNGYDIVIQGGATFQRALVFSGYSGGARSANPPIAGISFHLTDTVFSFGASYDGNGAFNEQFQRNSGSFTTDATTLGANAIGDNASVPFLLGAPSSSGAEYWNGILDEVRISNTARSHQWLYATAYGQWRPDFGTGGFYAVGPESILPSTRRPQVYVIT